MYIKVDLDLEKPCWSCGGSGKNQIYDKKGIFVKEESGPCSCCHGTGYLLTDFGEKVWEMVQRQLNAPTIKED